MVLTQTDDKKNPQFVGSSVKAELKAMLHRTIFCIFRENVTPSSGTSPLASYKKVPRPSEFLRRQVSVLKKKTDIARLGNKDELTQTSSSSHNESTRFERKQLTQKTGTIICIFL